MPLAVVVTGEEAAVRDVVIENVGDLELSAVCFVHQYRRVGWDLTRVMSYPTELQDQLDAGR